MNEETMIMETVKVNIVQGAVGGISQEAFEKLKDNVQHYFKNARWDNDTMHINTWILHRQF